MSSKRDLDALKKKIGTIGIPKVVPKYFALFFDFLSAYHDHPCQKYAKLAKKYWGEFSAMGKPRKPRENKRKREDDDEGPKQKKSKNEMEEQIESMMASAQPLILSDEKREAITTYRERIYEGLAQHQLYPDGELAKIVSELFNYIEDLASSSVKSENQSADNSERDEESN